MDVLSNIHTLHINASSANEALGLLAEYANNQSLVKPGFYQALIDREHEYPTGLHTSGIDVAIPHTDAEWTIKPALIIGILDNPVVFQPMGMEGSDVQAKIIFLIIISNPDDQIYLLKALGLILQDKEIMENLSGTTDLADFVNHLQSISDEVAEE